MAALPTVPLANNFSHRLNQTDGRIGVWHEAKGFLHLPVHLRHLTKDASDPRRCGRGQSMKQTRAAMSKPIFVAIGQGFALQF